jgi:hypothetical protein
MIYYKNYHLKLRNIKNQILVNNYHKTINIMTNLNLKLIMFK